MPKRGGGQGDQTEKKVVNRRGRQNEESYEDDNKVAKGADSGDSDDPWDTIANMKGGSGGSDDGTFTKMNTNFFLRDDEEAEVLFLDEDPVIFMGHTLKGQGEKSVFYRTEACQKSEQDYCTMCDTRNQNVSKARRVIAFRIMDFRGKWDTQKGGFDGEPSPKIFLVPLYLAKQIKILKDDTGSLIDKVAKLTKSGNYGINFVTVPRKGGGFDYDYIDFEDEFGDMELPEVSEVYAPSEDDYLDDFIDNYCNGAPAPSNNSSSRGSSRSGRQDSRGSLTSGRGSTSRRR